MSQSNFNFIAPVYDFLAYVIFGSQLKKAQTIFLNQIKHGDKVLVVGGGTGWILEDLNKLNKPINVVYVEPAAKMMSLSKARLKLNNLTIEYLQQPLLEMDSHQQFDVICTFFFLDLFEKELVLKSINKLEQLLNLNGRWLFADFVSEKQSPISHRILIKTMFLFFRSCANIQSKELLDYQQIILQLRFEKIESRQWKRGLIQGAVFRKI